MRRPVRPSGSSTSPRVPLDAVVEAMRHPTARAVPEPTSLSERAARRLANGPCDPLTLMREVCRVDRLKADAAIRMAEVLLGSRAEFVLLDDDRWALLRDGRVVGAGEGEAGISMPAGAAAAHQDHGSLAEQGIATNVRTPLLHALRFAVVDVETTGMRAGASDRVTEIAIVPVVDGVVGDPWQQLVHPGRPIPPMITALTGISNAMVADAPSFADIADDVCRRLGGHVFTAHNASFDRRFVDAELSRTRRTRLEGAALCTVHLTRRFVPALRRRSLDRVCGHFGIRIDGRHRAGGDALATAHVLVRLLHAAQDAGVTTWRDLQQRLDSPERRPARRSALPTPVQEDTSA